MIRVGHILPHWRFGGRTRGILNGIAAAPENVRWTGAAIRDAGQLNHESLRPLRGLYPVYCPAEGKWLVKADTFAAACQAVVDESDVVWLWGFEKPETFAGLDFKGRKVVVSSHGCNEWTARMLAGMLPYATHYAAVSKAAAAMFPADVRDKVEVIYNAVDESRVKPTMPEAEARTKFGLGPGPVALFLGRLADDKNPVDVATAMKQLGGTWQAVFAGAGDTAPVKTANHKAVFLHPGGRVGDVLNVASVLVMVSPSEGHCQAVNEAWLAGVPVVSTPVGAVPELEEKYGKLCVTVPVGAAPGVIADAVRRAAADANQNTVVRAQAMMKASFTLDKLGSDLSAFHAKVMSA